MAAGNPVDTCAVPLAEESVETELTTSSGGVIG